MTYLLVLQLSLSVSWATFYVDDADYGAQYGITGQRGQMVHKRYK